MFLPLYFLTLPIFFAIDMIWLTVVAKNFYAKYLGYLMAQQVNMAAAVIFYILFIAGLVVFVITPALQSHSWVKALTLGAFFGLISYATYDLSNLATIKDWPMIVTIVDLIWGTVLAAVVSVLSYLLAVKFGI